MSNLSSISLYIIKGSIVTFKLYMVTILFSLPLSTLLVLGRISKYESLRRLVAIYTWIFRGTPLLLQLFFTYYGLPVMGIRLTPFTAAALTFVLNYAAYFTEILRGGIESIDRGQYEAAKALGMSYGQTMGRIILPQAVKRILPAMANEAITLVKDTSLVTALGMQELLRNAKEIVTREFTITPFMVAAVLYLLITSFIVLFFRRLENKLAYYE